VVEAAKGRCPICEGTGWKTIEADQIRRVVRCDCWRDEVAERILRAARIPPLYKRCDLDNFHDHNDTLARAVTRARVFGESFPVIDKGLLFVGSPGVGKTHLAVATLKRAIRRTGAHGLFYATPELLALIRSTYNSSTRSTEADVIRPVMDAELLVLDDLGAERPTDWVEETMNLIVNTRYNHRRATIFTSNYPLAAPTGSHVEELKERVGFRLFSRLHEMCEFLPLEGVDYRQLPPNASPEDIASLDSKMGQAPAAPSRKSKPMAKARLKDVNFDVGWSGGKAGT
jgi:DNA replication protein DnaC